MRSIRQNMGGRGKTRLKRPRKREKGRRELLGIGHILTLLRKKTEKNKMIKTTSQEN